MKGMGEMQIGLKKMKLVALCWQISRTVCTECIWDLGSCYPRGFFDSGKSTIGDAGIGVWIIFLSFPVVYPFISFLTETNTTLKKGL